ncbi:MAG: T9SS type A sorting domain-containing protein [Flavobacteriales bacterium]
MKQLLTLSVVVLLTAGTQAQITITQAEMPHAGDQLARVQAVTNPFLNYGATGASYTWNFENLSANGNDATNYQSVASTNFVYAIVYADIFFNDNRANHAKPGTDIPLSNLLPIENPYTFRYRSSSSYRTVGFGLELSGIPLPITFDEQDVIYQLPLQFGNTSSSHSSYHIDVPNVGYYGFEQDRTNVVDGWGAITTPGGVFDVLRVKTTLNMSDSIGGLSIDRPVVREYKWLAQGLRVPVLQINTTSFFGTEVVTAVYYYDVPRSIHVVEPLANTLCPGAEVDVNYTITGAFNAGGFFVPANHFTAQLSDATGSFAAPVNIGDVTATTAGIISCTIPANTPIGSGYRIRVISTSPGFTGTSNSFPISIGGATEAAISAAGPTLICTGEALTLTAVGGPSYQWQRDGIDISGAITATYDAMLAGTYTVVVDNSCGTATSNAITVEVNAQPVQQLDTMPISICAGATAVITATDASGQSGVTYQWFLNDAPIAGAMDLALSATLGGIYTLQATNMATGCSYTTDGVAVTLITVTPPIITATDGTTFCAGGQVQLSAQAEAGATYQWLRNDTAISGATMVDLVVLEEGAYSFAITTNGCSATSDTINVVVHPLPAVPVIIQSYDSLLTTGEGTFQWFLDGNAITGATEAWLVPAAFGTYTVLYTDTNGCSNTSEDYAYISTFITNTSRPSMQVMPNPSNGIFTIVFPNAQGETYELLDATGKRVAMDRFTGTSTTVDLENAPSGIYFLRVLQNGDTPVQRIVINR